MCAHLLKYVPIYKMCDLLKYFPNNEDVCAHLFKYVPLPENVPSYIRKMPHYKNVPKFLNICVPSLSQVKLDSTVAYWHDFVAG
jgi:hypothetical protein